MRVRHFNHSSMTIFHYNFPSISSWLNIVRNYVQTDTCIKVKSVGIPKTSKDARIIN